MRIANIVPCLWFDDQAEAAAAFYTSIFPNSRITHVTRFTEVGQEFHGRPVGSVMTVEFEIAGQTFTALNGGPMFKFSEAVSFQIMCDTQAEVDAYWDALTAGGSPSQCGWLKDQFGVSWQVVPRKLQELFSGDPAKVARATQAMFHMQKFDIAALERAAKG